MKKLIQLMAFVVFMLSFVSQSIYAENNPGTAYISYGINGSNNWTWNQVMTKSSDGNTYTFTVKDVTGNLRFFVHKATKANWDAMTANGANVIYMADGVDYNSTIDNELKSDRQVYLYGTCKHCLKISDDALNNGKKADIKVSFYFNNGNAYIKYEVVEPKQFTIYFYDVNGNDHTDLKVHIWGDGDLYSWNNDAEKMTKTGLYVSSNGKNCPVWSYTFTSVNNYTSLMFHDNGSNVTEDLNNVFANGAVYNNNGKTSLSASDFISDSPVVAALYLHVKNDIRRHGQGKDYAPWVWLYKKGDSDNIKYEADLTHRQMKKVDGDVKGGGNEKYSLWKCDLTQEEINNYNACAFYFRNSANDGDKVYRSATYNNNSANNNSAGVANYDQTNWYKYIYATASNEEGGDFAVQTYLSYDEFKKLDNEDKKNGGRRNVYLVGGVNYGEWTPTDTNNDNIVKKGTLTSVPVEGIMFGHPDSDQGCFYIPLQKNGEDRWFKITWLDVKSLRKGGINSDRDWATFDLGLIGVMGFDNNNIKVEKTEVAHNLRDTDHKSIYFENVPPNGELYFKENQSVAYRNYNQANWVLPDNDQWYWLVLDSHDECRTATICTFNPQPTVDVKVSEIATETVDFETAKSIRDTPLKASNNGPIYMTELNKASGSATIIKSSGYVLGDAGYSVEYTVNLNGREIKSKNPGVINMDYIPLAVGDREISIRAKYVNDGGDNPTGLSFHSRTSKSAIKLPVISLNAPTSVTLEGRYIYQGINEKTGKQVYGVYVEGLYCEPKQVVIAGTTTPLNVYSDFRFNEGTGWFVHEGLDWYETYGSLVKDVKTWDCWTPDADNYVDWSTNLMDTNHPAPLFIKDVVEVDSFDEIKALDTKKITGEVYAVYPFLYNPNANYEVIPANAPRRAAQNYDGFVVANTYMPADISVSVSGKNAVSGIETVEAESSDNAPVEYYTISGVRVIGEPAPGLYIRRQGEKVSKVVVR